MNYSILRLFIVYSQYFLCSNILIFIFVPTFFVPIVFETLPATLLD